MADVFQSAPMSYGGGFRSDLGMLETTDGISGILMQNIQVTYQRPITKIYELGNKNTARPPLLAAAGTGTNVYYVEGRPQGSLTLARILGFAASINAFYVKYGSACEAGANTMTLALNSSECVGPGVQVKLAMSFCVLTSVGVSVNAQQLVINENCGMEFANMVYTGP
jgi:hypothetical protein